MVVLINYAKVMSIQRMNGNNSYFEGWVDVLVRDYTVVEFI